MPEGARAYPRWEGALRTGSLFGVVAAQEVRRAFLNLWSRLALVFLIAYSVVNLGNLYTLGQSSGDRVHTMANFLDFLDEIRWVTLVVGAIMAGPALLEDKRRGALDLYYSRAVTTWDYLAGKILAIFGLITLGVFVPALLYWASTFVFFETHPEGWNTILLGVLGYSIIWGLLVSGLGLGLSSVSRSSVGATVILLGGFVILEIFVGQLLSGITEDPQFRILSPFSALAQQATWLFGVERPYEFETWWGAVELVALIVAGWALVAWRHPRVRGEDTAGD